MVVIGTTLLLLGVILVFTPGPAVVVVAAALAVLAIEFTWARRWLRKLKAAAELASPRPAEVPCERSVGNPSGEIDGLDGPRAP